MVIHPDLRFPSNLKSTSTSLNCFLMLSVRNSVDCYKFALLALLNLVDCYKFALLALLNLAVKDERIFCQGLLCYPE
ncbi:hypothetical protein LINPERPRIM_LOCUS42946 [Linum perenne]